MRRVLVGLALASAVVLAMGADALACGDKFLVIGRGIKYRVKKAEHPASILTLHAARVSPSGGSP